MNNRFNKPQQPKPDMFKTEDTKNMTPANYYYPDDNEDTTETLGSDYFNKRQSLNSTFTKFGQKSNNLNQANSTSINENKGIFNNSSMIDLGNRNESKNLMPQNRFSNDNTKNDIMNFNSSINHQNKKEIQIPFKRSSKKRWLHIYMYERPSKCKKFSRDNSST